MSSKIIKKLEEQNQAITKLEKIVFSGRVDWSALKNILMNTDVDINGSINRKIYEEENLIIFKTEILKDFAPHYHPFNEHVLVLEGECEDEYGSYKSGDKIHYSPFMWHHIRKVGSAALSILVTFTR